jgi:hypothetical protein
MLTAALPSSCGLPEEEEPSPALSATAQAVAFELVDGDLRPAEVLWALQQVRANKARPGIPSPQEWNVIGASYYNAQYPNCDTYTHTDHRAIHILPLRTEAGILEALVLRPVCGRDSFSRIERPPRQRVQFSRSMSRRAPVCAS